MYKHIKNLLDSTINEDVILEIPKNSKMGHFSTPIAMMLAKKQNKNPNEIAGDIKKKLESLYEFKAINIVNGFINLELSDDFLSKSAKDAISNPNNFAKNNHNKKILLEFVSANPTGPLHIGHARGAIFGDTLARVATHLGYDIKREYYINDAGSQIDMLGNSILLAGREILGFQVEYPEEFYRGDYIVDIARDTIDSLGKQVFIDSDIDTISQFGMKATLSLIKSTLKDAKISFDYFVSEKSLINELDGVLKKLKENNAIYTKDSKVWLKSSLNGDEKDRVIIRDNNLEVAPIIYARFYASEINDTQAMVRKNRNYLGLPFIIDSTGDRAQDDKNALELKNILTADKNTVAVVSSAMKQLTLLDLKPQYVGRELMELTRDYKNFFYE